MTVGSNQTIALVLVCRCTYDVTKKIVDKFLVTGTFEAGDDATLKMMMQSWKAAFLRELATQCHAPCETIISRLFKKLLCVIIEQSTDDCLPRSMTLSSNP